jgi:hypothetical protein
MQEALINELRNMNEELLIKEGNDSLSDLELFKNQHAVAVLQLEDASVQVNET